MQTNVDGEELCGAHSQQGGRAACFSGEQSTVACSADAAAAFGGVSEQPQSGHSQAL